jgi:phytoene desaturase
MADVKTSYDTIVIGGGLSGLATALRRKRRGDRVLLLEKNEKLGGKLDQLSWNNYRWDKGPSLFTLPQLVDDLFELFEKNAKDYFDYVLHEENCRYFFNDGTKFTVYTDPEMRKQELRLVFNKQEVSEVEAYLKKSADTYAAIGDMFIGASKLSLKDAFRFDVIKQYPKLLSRQMLSTLDKYNQRKLSNEKLIQLFNRFGTYNGSNPYKMSGLYSMIPHLEMNTGTFFPKGGMRSIVESLEKLAREEGIEIRLGQKNIRSDKSDKGFTVDTENSRYTCEQLVCSIDHVSFYKNVFSDEKALKNALTEERSSSGLIFYWAISKKINEIGLHNILFSDDYKKEFETIFNRQDIPIQPTIYIHNSSAVQKDDAPQNGQNWFVMINTPAGVEPTKDQIDKLRSYIIKQVKKLISVDIQGLIEFEDRWTMKNIEGITGSYQGALYGGAFNSKLSSFKRHGNQSKVHKNLYFTGGSVHPGGGIPLVLKSAKIVDELMERNG